MASMGSQPITSTTIFSEDQIQAPNRIPSSHLYTSATENTTTATISNSFNGKKRTLDCVVLQSTPYFKMRAVVRDLRSLFLEVIRAPDIQNCKAAHGIQEKLKVMVDLCKQKTVQNVPMTKCNNGGGGISEPHQNIRPLDQPPQADRSFARSAEERRFPVGNNVEKPESNRNSGTYVVGGSAFGWNFITFHGTKPEYYGRTKEAFRAGK